MNTVTTPTIETHPVESSQIHSVGHDAATNTLAIRFKNRTTGAPTSLYFYSNVTPELFAEFKGAASLGSYHGRVIKSDPKKFPFRKIEDAPSAAIDE